MQQIICVILVIGFAGGPLCAATADADAVFVQETHWGFDGTILRRTYLPVSFLVQNVTPATVTVRFRLQRLVGFDKPVGTVLAREVTLSGNSSRWLQFTPLIVDENESWKLSWGPGEKHQIDLPQVNLGQRATVLIYSRDDVTPAGGVLRRMPEELFPTSITATDGLRGVILNKSPYWQGGRARAFLEWLRTGGRVYILHGRNGEFPEFPAPLEVLNQRQDRFHVGTGTVKRIARSVEEIDLAFAQAELFNDETSEAALPARSYDPQLVSMGAGVTWNRDYRIESNLVSLARFRRNWWLIYLCAAGYLLSLWPGCYWVARTLANHRLYYVGFFSSVVLFSLIFIGLGQVGASMRNRTRSVAVARQLHGDVYDVLQWTSVAVIQGGDYTIRHQGSGTCFANSNEFEAVLGSFDVGNKPHATFTIPPAGTRTFQHRKRLNSPRPLPQFRDVAVQDGILTGLTVETAGAFPRTPFAALAIFRGQAYELEVDWNRLDLGPRARGRPLLSLLYETPVQGFGTFVKFRMYDDENDSRTDRAIYNDMFLPLLAASLGLDEFLSTHEVDLPPDVVRVIIFADMNDEFFAEADLFPDQLGRVLYTYDVPVEAAP